MPTLRDAQTASEILHIIRTKKDAFWSRERERRPLELFHEAARRVPAYKDFLRKNKINPQKIKTFKDFELVPPISKKNYLRQYPIEKLCWDGSLKKPLVWTSTSGSTGEPFYFPRGGKLDWEYSILSELFLGNGSAKKGEPILVIVGLSMGVWIAGLFSYQAFKMAAERGGYAASIITPGINKLEILKALRRLAPHFRQTILLGYPPFLKDVLDEAVEERINLRKLNIRLLSGAEAFTEKFRDYLAKKARIRNPCLDTLNVYGTADIGTMAYETPTAILIRRLAMRNRKLFHEIFTPIEKTPTLAQYNPLFITFESINGDILLSGDNTIPFVRYTVGDHGGVLSLGEVAAKLKHHGINLRKEAKRAGIANHIYELPFVYVYERADFSTTLYGLQIYPETIREALIHKYLSRFLTGKFTMLTTFDAKQNQYLELHLELRKRKKAHKRLEKHTLREIILNLRLNNSEFRELHDFLKDRALPRLAFWPSGHPKYFPSGVKQRWAQKE